jgi:large subunit ribosomal protein L30
LLQNEKAIVLQKKEGFFRKVLKVNSRKLWLLLVKQVRSKINCPLDQKRALGLRKMGQIVEHDSNPTILGMINKVKHLVSEETK